MTDTLKISDEELVEKVQNGDKQSFNLLVSRYSEKIYLGIHFYGYDWLEEEARDLTYNDVLDLIDEYSPTISTSEEQEKNFTYTDDEDEKTVYFADYETILPRLTLVNEYDIAGIGIWSLGQEDPKNWQSIYEVLK